MMTRQAPNDAAYQMNPIVYSSQNERQKLKDIASQKQQKAGGNEQDAEEALRRYSIGGLPSVMTKPHNNHTFQTDFGHFHGCQQRHNATSEVWVKEATESRKKWERETVQRDNIILVAYLFIVAINCDNWVEPNASQYNDPRQHTVYSYLSFNN